MDFSSSAVINWRKAWEGACEEKMTDTKIKRGLWTRQVLASASKDLLQ